MLRFFFSDLDNLLVGDFFSYIILMSYINRIVFLLKAKILLLLIGTLKIADYSTE